LVQPFTQSVQQLSPAVSPPESRKILSDWIQENHDGGDIAIAGQLQLALEVLKLPGVERSDEKRALIQELASGGYRWIVTTSQFIPPPEAESFLKELERIPGANEPQRIVNNPAIRRFEVIPTGEALKTFDAFRTNLQLPTCIGNDPGEDYCWLSTRTGEVTILKSALRGTTLSIMTPWRNQQVSIRSSVGIELKRLENLEPNRWYNVHVDSEAPKLTLHISEIHSPARRLGSPDTRRLGVAVKLAPAE